VKNWLTWGLGIVIGATAGYLYWYYVGCMSGSCAITSSPVNSTLYGSVLGALVVNALGPAKRKSKDHDQQKKNE
jgi:phage shock protein E